MDLLLFEVLVFVLLPLFRLERLPLFRLNMLFLVLVLFLDWALQSRSGALATVGLVPCFVYPL